MQIGLLFLSHDHVESALMHQCSKKTPKTEELLLVTELPPQDKCSVLFGQFRKQSVPDFFSCCHAIEIISTKLTSSVQPLSSATAQPAGPQSQRGEAASPTLQNA